MNDQTLDEMEQALRLMRKNNQIDDNELHKQLVRLVWENSNVKRFDKAAEILRSFPDLYHREQLAVQMREDSEFCDLAVEVAKKLVEAGIADLTPELRWTGPIPTA